MSKLLTADRHSLAYFRSWQAEPTGVSQTVERSRRQPPTDQGPSWREDVFKQLRKFLTYKDNWNGYGDRSDRSDVVARVQAAVERSGMTKAEFASSVGTSASRLSTYLSGKVVPSAAMLVRIERTAASGLDRHRTPA